MGIFSKKLENFGLEVIGQIIVSQYGVMLLWLPHVEDCNAPNSQRFKFFELGLRILLQSFSQNELSSALDHLLGNVFVTVDKVNHKVTMLQQ